MEKAEQSSSNWAVFVDDEKEFGWTPTALLWKKTRLMRRFEAGR